MQSECHGLISRRPFHGRRRRPGAPEQVVTNRGRVVYRPVPATRVTRHAFREAGKRRPASAALQTAPVQSGRPARRQGERLFVSVLLTMRSAGHEAAAVSRSRAPTAAVIVCHGHHAGTRLLLARGWECRASASFWSGQRG